MADTEVKTYKKVFQLLVDNTSGTLSRISGLFSRRGYNIESITAGTTADPRFTRITIVAFLRLLDGYTILELARTGIAGLGRGIDSVVYLDE